MTDSPSVRHIVRDVGGVVLGASVPRRRVAGQSARQGTVSKTVGNCALLEGVQDHELTPTDTEELARIADLFEATDFAAPLPDQSEPTSTVWDDLDVLIYAAISGERDAVEGVLRWVRPLVVRYCRTRLGGQEKTFASADDVAQEVCLAVLTALPRYRDQGRPFLAFVYGIAAHKVSDARRSAARNRAEPVPDVPDTLAWAEDGPEAQVMRSEMAERVGRLLSTLPDNQREILRLRVVVGLSAEETAEAVGSTPGAVRVAQHRALNRLRGVLASTPQVLYQGVWARPDHHGDRHDVALATLGR
ncbi:MAG: sigma-70 family RNA polymerase sigma factor [Pseudonocardiales bacterium]|nr:sigma-70 family RNA polymerase sigma factor [Pseudonocardiales bacterium]MBV9031171.1 sigma-70 family RNA polymerase sigma factor [Pseudonocardiales bacterium]MBW0009377.1 sigma-70 family RNA polymerase sigma factor [Pseudonocardiales bacterium]